MRYLTLTSFPTVALAYIGDALHVRYLPIAISVLSTGSLLAGIFGQLYAQVIQHYMQWNDVFWILAFSYCVGAWLIHHLPTHGSPHNRVTLAQVLPQFIKLTSIPPLVLSFMIAATLFLCFVTMYSALSVYLLVQFNMHYEGILWVRIAGIPGIMISLLSGPLINRFAARRVLIVGLLVAGTSLSLEGLSITLPMMIISSCLVVAGISISIPSTFVMIGSLAGESRGSAFAFNAGFMFIGASLGELLAAHTSAFWLVCCILTLLLWTAAFGVWVCLFKHKCPLYSLMD